MTPQLPDWFKPKQFQRLLNGKLYAEATEAQTRMILSNAYETMAGGARLGGKTFAGYMWLGKGNQQQDRNGHVIMRPDVDPKHPAYGSYLEWPEYRALALRWEASDMKDWCDGFEAFYRPLYPKLKRADDPPIFVFPSGAKIYTNHLRDSSAYEKYKGWNIARLLIEELTQIADRDLYLKMFGVLRVPAGGATEKNVFPQILSTTNPDGVGAAWVRERFVYVMSGGQPIPWGTKMRNPISGLTRVFIPAKVRDNPYASSQYIAQLKEQSPAVRRAWLDGDWDALTGQYFDLFRPEGPKPDDPEPEHACHVVKRDSVVLKPWYTRWMSMDWGYAHNCAVYWYCETPEGRVYVYREMVMSGVSSFNMGVEAAKASIGDLGGLPSHHMTVFISPDVMTYDDEAHNIGAQICGGFNSVLGPQSAFIHQMTPEEKQLQQRDPEAAARALNLRRESMNGFTQISIVRASNDRVGGWNYMRDLMRWWKVAPAFNEEEAKLVYARQGHVGLEHFLSTARQLERKDEGPLPVFQILDCCPKAIRALRDARRDEAKPEDITKKHWDGADSVDSLRYGLAGRRDVMAVQPKAYYVADHLARARAEGITDINLLIQAGTFASEQYDGTQAVSTKPVRFARLAVPPPTKLPEAWRPM